MRILVTGAGGFVGRNVVLGLNREHELTAVYRGLGKFSDWAARYGVRALRRCDLTDANAVCEAFAADQHFDVVIHLAANGDPAASVSRPAMDLRSGPLALLTLFERIRAGRLIYFSSGAVYEGAEGVVTPATPVAPTLPYAISKLACEQYARSLCKRLRRVESSMVVRFFGAFGPYEPERKVYTRLVRAFGIEHQRRFTVRGDGHNRIDAMYVADAVDAIRRLLTAPRGSATLDVTCGAAMTMDELVRRAATCFGIPDVEILHEGQVPEYNRFQADPSGAADAIGFRASTPLEVGLQMLHSHLRSANGGTQ